MASPEIITPRESMDEAPRRGAGERADLLGRTDGRADGHERR